MKKEESKVIAQKLQKIPNGTLALKHCRAGGTGTTLFGEQFRAVTAGKGYMEAYETWHYSLYADRGLLPRKPGFSDNPREKRRFYGRG